ncbi:MULTISPECIES: hypothetical protein [unclassified Streptomyces]|uniref:hypothetical protein n=1 Tax=unclassified Streptomyces TaxID=2593676 RepID=UPI002E28305A|nr:hypothetical protein [Streptomyces sp. NBC_00273]
MLSEQGLGLGLLLAGEVGQDPVCGGRDGDLAVGSVMGRGRVDPHNEPTRGYGVARVDGPFQE